MQQLHILQNPKRRVGKIWKSQWKAFCSLLLVFAFYAPTFGQQTCPQPIINMSSGQVCAGEAVLFSAPDLGFPCLSYAWDFGAGASPQFATGQGPFLVTYSFSGARSVELTIDNGCDANGGGSGSGSGSGSGGNGSGSGSGSGGSNGGVICGGSNGSGSGSGSGGGGAGSGSGSGSGGGGIDCNGIGGAGSGSGSGSGGGAGSGSGSGSGSGAGNGGGDCPCIECRETTVMNFMVMDCNSCANQGGDSDNDGICNNQDCQPFNPSFPATPGTPCNDGNPNTSNDVIQGDGCSCAGSTNDPCANQGGDSDNDGVCNNQDCQPFNPAFPANPGTPCNDGNPNTNNDVVTSDGCNCAGTPTGPACTVSTNGCSITITGLNSSDQAKVFDANWTVVWECNPWTGNICNNTETITNLNNGLYYVQACGSTDPYTVSGCGPTDPCANQGGDSDNDGVCNNQDCQPFNPSFPATPGTACNDGNPNTVNDVVQGDGCSCAGSVQDPCANQGGDSDNDGVCNNQDCQPFNPAFPATPGTACNDGNPNTNNDVVTADGCGCAGTPTGPACSVTTGNCSITITGLNSSDYAKVFDANWSIVWECNPWVSGGCNSTETISNLSSGTYNVQACGSTTPYTVTCNGGGNMPSISIGDVTVNEDDGSATLTASLNTPSNSTVTVNYQTANGSATTNNDYTFKSGQITFAPGQTTSSVTFNIVNDNTPENTENFLVNLSGANNGNIADNQGTITILDTDNGGGGGSCNVTTNACSITITGLNSSDYAKVFDSNWNIVWECNPWVSGGCNSTETITNLSNGIYNVQACGSTTPYTITGCGGGGGGGGNTPKLSVSDQTLNEGDGNAVVQVCLNTTSSQMVMFNYTTANGSATFGLDYNTVSGSRSISPGNLCTSVTIPVNEDGIVEGSENFYLDISNPSNATIDDGRGRITIIDNDNGGGGNPDCSNVNFSVVQNNTAIQISGLTAPNQIVQAFSPSWTQIFNCSSNCNETETITGLGAGTYYIKVSFYSASWEKICDKAVHVICGGGSGLVSPDEGDNFAFTAQRTDMEVSLSWITDTEFKNDLFVVERSVDGIDFEAINEVVSNSNEWNAPNNYDEADESPALGANFYRIKKLHKDGTHEYSEIRDVRFDVDVTNFIIFPNPANNEVHISLREFAGQKGNVVLHNTLGQVVTSRNFDELPEDVITFSLDQMAPGLHTITLLLDSGKAVTKKLVVTKR